MTVPRMNLAQYVNPGNPLPNIDITGAYRQWQAQHLNEDQLAEQKRQFDLNQAQQDSQFAQEQGLRERSADDVNARFGLELGEKTNARGYDQESNRYKLQQSLLSKARQAGAEGRWNEVESMLGTLKELGADVGREMDHEGKPVYHLQGGNAPTASGETFQSALGQINHNRGSQQPYQFNPEQPQLSVPGRSPFDTNIGTISQSVSPNVPPDVFQNTQGPSEEAGYQSRPSSSFDPYEINSSQLQKMNEMRLRPLMEGIEGAFPNRFQPQINSLLGGIAALGSSPEGYLEHLQKPMDTAARLMSSEMTAEGQMARAGISQSGKEDSQSRLLVNDGEKSAERVAKEYGVTNAVSNSIEMQQIAEQLMSDNPNGNADGIKALLSMREGNRLTDKDFNIGATGLASNFTQLATALTRVYRDGLTPDQKSNFAGLIKNFQDGNRRRIQAGSKAMMNYVRKLRTEPERYGAWRHITGSIPDEYLPQELKDWDPAKNSFGGQRSPGGSGKRKSVTVTAPTPQAAIEGAGQLYDQDQDINSDIDNLTKELDQYEEDKQ